MAKKRRKHQSFLDQLMYSANSRVFWVVLLVVVSFTFAFTPQVMNVLRPGRGDAVAARIFGEPVSHAELTVLDQRIDRVRRVLGSVGQFGVMAFADVASSFGMLEFRTDAYLYLAEAERLGLRVSDLELGETRRRVWRWMRAREQALAEPPPQRSQGFPNREYQVYFKQQEIAGQLEERNVFDLEDWKEKVRRISGLSPVVFEEALRKVMLLAKLNQYVRSTVTVSDKELYQRFNEQYQKRKFSWVRLEPSEELEKAVKESIEDSELEAYLDRTKNFDREFALSLSYLLIPRQHFEEKVEAGIQEEDLEEAYETDKKAYPRPDIRATDAAFALLTKEEMETQDKELYLPFEEVTDEVREKLLKERTDKEIRAFADGLKSRLYPAGGGEGESPAKLAEEYEFLILGRVPPSSAADAEESFGEAYTDDVRKLLAKVRSSGGYIRDSDREALKGYKALPEDRGYVFYLDVQHHPKYRPALEDVRDKVFEAVYGEKLLERLAEAARKKVEELDAGSTTLAALAEQQVEVEVSEGAKATARFGKIRSTPHFVATYTPIRVPREWDERKEDETSEEEDVAKADDDSEDDTVVHVSSEAIRDQGFTIQSQGKATVATDKAQTACYVVTFDDMVKPDPSTFDDRRDILKYGRPGNPGLLPARQDKYFQDWSRELRNRAFPEWTPPEESEEASEEVATSG